MKKYTIKYEDCSGDVHTEFYIAHSEQHALSMLTHPLKEMYRIDSENVGVSMEERKKWMNIDPHGEIY